MDQQSTVELRAQAAVVWQRVRTLAAGVPLKAWVVLGFFLTAALLMAVHTALSAKDANLRLKVQHSFRSAQLSVWVDGELAYSGNSLDTSGNDSVSSPTRCRELCPKPCRSPRARTRSAYVSPPMTVLSRRTLSVPSLPATASGHYW